MNISNLMLQTDPNYQDHRFNEFLETHLNFLRKNKSRVVDQVEPSIADKYIGDFYGLLAYYRIPVDHHYITTRLNGFTSSDDYDGSVIVIARISDEHLALLKNIWRTKEGQK